MFRSPPADFDRALDRLRIVPVDMLDDTPSVGAKARRLLIGEPALDVSIDRDAIVVVERGELPETPCTGERARFTGNTFHQTTIAENDVHVAVDNVESRRVDPAAGSRLASAMPTAWRGPDPAGQRRSRHLESSPARDART